MKRLFKAPVILTLTFAVFVFSIYCCCFIHPAEASQATEETPSCHQTEHKQDQSHDSQECHCHTDLVGRPQLEKISNIDLSQSIFSIVFSHISLSAQFPMQVSSQSFPESPPYFSSAVLLYIKHSNFRL